MAAKKETAAPAASSDKKKAIETAMQQIEKMYGKGSIMRYGDGNVANVEAIPTGSLALDLALGIGGLPRGRVVEIYGPDPPVRPRWRCTCWPRPRKWAVRWPLWTPSTRWIPPMPRRWASTWRIC